jgi:hypothetical protein
MNRTGDECGRVREALTGGWRKTLNELNDLHSLPNIIRLISSTHGRRREMHIVLV